MFDYTAPKKMKKLGDLFDKYRLRFKAPQATVEKECIKVIKEITDYNISLNQVNYNVTTKSIYLQVPSVLKTELKFKHPLILQSLRNNLGVEGAPKNIL